MKRYAHVAHVVAILGTLVLSACGTTHNQSETLAKSSRKLGSQCGLIDSNEDDGWRQDGKINHVNNVKPETLSALSTLSKQQIIITAKYEVKAASDVASIQNTVDALTYLQQGDGADIINSVVKNKKDVTEIMYYPGDNPYSVIFAAGTTTVLGYGEDGTVYCK